MYHDIYQNVCVIEFTAELLSDIVDLIIYFKFLNEQKLNSVCNRNVTFCLVIINNFINYIQYMLIIQNSAEFKNAS